MIIFARENQRKIPIARSNGSSRRRADEPISPSYLSAFPAPLPTIERHVRLNDHGGYLPRACIRDAMQQRAR